MTQNLPLRDQLRVLEQLQELDLKISNIEKKKSSLPESLKELDRQLMGFKKTLTTKATEKEEVNKSQRQLKAAQDLNQDRQTRAAGKLDGVGNQQEFQAASREIEQLKKSNDELQRQQDELKAKVDLIEKDCTDIEAQMGTVQAERDKAASAVNGQVSEMDGSLKELLGERDAKTVSVRKDILVRYDRVRGARAGLGIVPATGGRCNGCNMHLPPQLFNLVQRAEEVLNCPSCHRILFVPGSGN